MIDGHQLSPRDRHFLSQLEQTAIEIADPVRGTYFEAIVAAARQCDRFPGSYEDARRLLEHSQVVDLKGAEVKGGEIAMVRVGAESEAA